MGLVFSICVRLVAVFAGVAAWPRMGYPLLTRQAALAAAIVFPSLAGFVLFSPNASAKRRRLHPAQAG